MHLRYPRFVVARLAAQPTFTEAAPWQQLRHLMFVCKITQSLSMTSTFAAVAQPHGTDQGVHVAVANCWYMLCLYGMNDSLLDQAANVLAQAEVPRDERKHSHQNDS